jgi:hypothetical protein
MESVGRGLARLSAHSIRVRRLSGSMANLASISIAVDEHAPDGHDGFINDSPWKR